MKPLEEAFGSSAFRRVILPGIVVTAGVHPILKVALPFLHDLYGIDGNILIVIEVIVFGLVVSSAIQWIYYLYEGFEAPWLTAWAGRRTKRRLANLLAELSKIQSGKKWEALTSKERDRASIIYEKLQDYPIEMKDGVPVRYVERPTLLGNVIATYELYAQSRYQVEDIQFWNHLTLLAPTEARKEFAEQYAFAEGLVLTSFSGVIVAVLHAGALVVRLLSFLTARSFLLPYLNAPYVSLIICVGGLLVWVGFYKAAVSAHREAGSTMRTMVDLAFPSFVAWTNLLQSAIESDEPDWRTTLGAWLKDLRRS